MGEKKKLMNRMAAIKAMRARWVFRYRNPSPMSERARRNVSFSSEGLCS